MVRLAAAASLAPRRWLALAGTCSLLVGCGAENRADGDLPESGSGGDARSEGRDGELEASGDGSLQGPVPGSISQVVADFNFIDVRLCDLDGDGTLDNSLADLGTPFGALFAGALSTVVHTLEFRRQHLLFHFPTVDDVTVPETAATEVATLLVLDRDEPPNDADDFSGEEEFFALSQVVDACGEPAFSFPVARVEAGALTAESGVVTLPFDQVTLTLEGARLDGMIEPHGAGSTLTLCAQLPIADLGGHPFPFNEEITLLEAFLLGGPAFDLSAIPGLSPDVDVDGDGLERLELDESHQVARCIDGDLSVIEGRDCWEDPRMADAFSLSGEGEGVSAVLLGPRPTWRWEVGGECSEPPTEESGWGPCPGDLCERWATESCTTPCGVEGARRCAFDCRSWSGCVSDESTADAARTCEDTSVEGTATCDDGRGTVRIVDAATGTGGVRLAGDVDVRRGPVVIDARVTASRRTTEHPGYGWALVAYAEPGTSWLGWGGLGLGVTYEAEGYAVEWHFRRELEDLPDSDKVRLLAVDGTGSLDVHVASASQGVTPPLHSQTEGAVEQGLRLVIEPDIPETDVDETMVVVLLADGPGYRMTGASCYDGSCPVTISAGDRLTVGITASTGEGDSIVDVALGDEPGLAAEARGSCP